MSSEAQITLIICVTILLLAAMILGCAIMGVGSGARKERERDQLTHGEDPR